MIKVQNLTPDVYYNHSRDFQFLGRLYDVVLNSVKTNADLLAELPLSSNSDTKWLDLMTTTLGFQTKHNYNVAQLKALCSTFIYIMHNKGNTQSILTAVNTLLNAMGIKDSGAVTVDLDTYTVRIFVSNKLKDLNLLYDLLNYILPAGLSFEIIKESKYSGSYATEISIDAPANRETMNDTDLKVTSKFEVSKDRYNATNIINNATIVKFNTSSSENKNAKKQTTKRPSGTN